MITSPKTRKWLGIALVALFALWLFPVEPMIGTARDIKKANAFLRALPTERELRVAYRSPAQVYPDYESVPEYYRRGLGNYPNCEFQLYQREGFPYWYLVAAVNRQSRVVDGGVAKELGK